MNTFPASYLPCVVAALSLLLIAACSSEQVASGPNIVARWKTCKDPTGGPTNRTVLESIRWAEGTLIVNVKDNDSCGGTRIANLRYMVSGDRVQLSWTWELGPEKALTACACDHSIRFELSNLPRGDYQVQLARER